MQSLENEWKELNEVENSVYVPCGKCSDGYVRVAKEKSKIGFNYEVCDCLTKREWLIKCAKNLKNANISGRLKTHFKFDSYVFDKLQKEELFLLLEETEEKNWVYLYGGPGSGKTYTSALLSKLALLSGQTVYFTGVAMLLDALRPDGLDKGIMERCAEVDVLVLDDIGQEKASQWVRERLYMIINARWESMKKTIFTSNLSAEHLKTSISPAVYSRVKGESVEIHLNTLKDRRL